MNFKAWVATESLLRRRSSAEATQVRDDDLVPALGQDRHDLVVGAHVIWKTVEQHRCVGGSLVRDLEDSGRGLPISHAAILVETLRRSSTKNELGDETPPEQEHTENDGCHDHEAQLHALVARQAQQHPDRDGRDPQDQPGRRNPQRGLPRSRDEPTDDKPNGEWPQSNERATDRILVVTSSSDQDEDENEDEIDYKGEYRSALH